MRRIAIALWVLGLATGVGCRPPLERLTEQRAYDQAFCAALRSPDSDHTFVSLAPKLDADARPRLHLHAVPRAELERSLGEAGRRLADQAVLVRAVVAIDGVQVDEFGVRVTLVEPRGPVTAQPASVEVLAELVGETIPADWVGTRRVLGGGLFYQMPLFGMALWPLEDSTLYILPTTIVTAHSRVTPDPPTLSTEVRAAAPVASMVAEQAALLSHAEVGKGPETASVWLWPRPPEGELRLFVEWGYAAYRCAGRKPALRSASLSDPKVVTATIEIPLPPGDDLESRLNAAFGDRMRLLAP